MQRILRGIVFPVAAFAIVSFAWAAQQQRDEAAAVRTSNWQEMWNIAKDAQTAKDSELSNRKFEEAWGYAMFWADYKPANRDSGSRRVSAMAGMDAMRREGAPSGADMQRLFNQYDALLRQNPPLVFSGGPRNAGLWRDQDGTIYNIRQTSSRVDGNSAAQGGRLRIFEGRGFNGATIEVEIGEPADNFTGYEGTMTFNGNTLSGTLKGARLDERGQRMALPDRVFTLERRWTQ